MVSKKEILIKNLLTVFTFFYITNVIFCETVRAKPTCDAKIWPSDEISLEENDTLLAYCQLTNVTTKCNSQYLSFDADTNMEYTRIINDSTIELKIPNAKAMEKYFICKYKKLEGLLPFSVQIGHKPAKVKLICLSKNFESLICRAELPPNTVTVQYTARYWLSTPTTLMFSQIANCTDEFRINKTCTVSPFRRFWNHTFEITGTNKLGNFTQRETFDIKRIVVPNKPIDVTVTNVTSRSANLSWSLPPNFKVFRAEKHIDFDHRVTLRMMINGLADKHVININTTNVKRIDTVKFNLELTDLEYAHTWYNVQIFYRVTNATYPELQWSEHSAIVFETKGRKPDTPPEASPSAFYILDQNETIIYWKELPSVKHNGPNLTYKIVEVTENGQTIKKEPKGPFSTTTARFDAINPNKDYEFKLTAENQLGSSDNYSTIRIPSVRNRLPKPINLKKILSQSIYNLTWEYPSDGHLPISYTIFRCDPIDEQESLCDHLIDFEQVDGRETQYIYNNTIEKNTKIFAITANNYNENSSGMSWFPCSATVNSDMTKFPAWLEVAGPQKMKVSWSLRCDTTPLLQGFNISYCAVIGDPKEEKCAPGGEFRQFVPEKHNETIITNLTAYTTYLVKLAMFNGKETGPAVTLQNTTASGVPTPPTNLREIRKTNNSITLEWNQPEFWNGKDQSYKIEYTTTEAKPLVRIVERVSDIYLPTNYTIDDLDSFTFYTIKIAGCNPACSNYSNAIMIKTKTGKPKPVQSVVNVGESIRPIYEWSPPVFRGGNLDFYEFKIGIKINGKYLPNPRIIVLNSTQCTLRSKVCNENVGQYNVSVRAVNMVKREIPLSTDSYYSRNHYEHGQMDKSSQISCIEELNHNFYYQCNTEYECIAGDWMVGFISECLYDSATFRFYLILFVGFFMGFGILVGVVIGMKKFHKMRDIGVELPEGLEDIDKVKPPMDNSKPDKMDNNKLDDEQTMRLIGTDNKSASSFSLEHKSQSSEFIDSDNEHTLNEDSASNSPIYDNMSNDNLKFDDSSNSNKNIDVIQNPQTIIQVMNPINNIPQSIPIMSNGYVANSFMAPSSNGYVQHSALMNMNIPVASNGYTSIAALMNQNKQAANRVDSLKQQPDTTNNIKTPIVTSTNGISGYVTHKQLSDFHNTLMQ